VEPDGVRALEKALHAQEISHFLVPLNHLPAASLDSQIVKETVLLFLAWTGWHKNLLRLCAIHYPTPTWATIGEFISLIVARNSVETIANVHAGTRIANLAAKNCGGRAG
jgi:hypothetical protein